MWLHVHMLGTKQLLAPLNSQKLSLVHLGAASIVPLARVPLSILVGEH